MIEAAISRVWCPYSIVALVWHFSMTWKSWLLEVIYVGFPCWKCVITSFQDYWKPLFVVSLRFKHEFSLKAAMIRILVHFFKADIIRVCWIFYLFEPPWESNIYIFSFYFLEPLFEAVTWIKEFWIYYDWIFCSFTC